MAATDARTSTAGPPGQLRMALDADAALLVERMQAAAGAAA
jgi:hypothetical protein